MDDWLDIHKRQSRLFISCNAARLLILDFMDNDNMMDEILGMLMPY